MIGGKDCQAVTKTPKHEETFKIGQRITVRALHTPCHTQDSICWFMEDGQDKVVFTGDTLFVGGYSHSHHQQVYMAEIQCRMRKILRRNASGDAYSIEQNIGSAAGRYQGLREYRPSCATPYSSPDQSSRVMSIQSRMSSSLSRCYRQSR